ncbi:MAG: hypothetical protein K9N51_02590 [Candidatus Pacebacteria bacterium]|nr:hypothetical protein [Candidatus Paceibacterota bacterium]
MTIVVTGFTSTGKTATGCCIAGILGCDHFDLDDCIEALFASETGRTLAVREMFVELGEDVFEEWEVRALHELELRDRFILSTGGRTPLIPVVQPLLKALGKVVYLRAKPEAIFERMKAKGFPAYLGNEPTLADLTHIWRERNRIYELLADVCIDNTDLTVEQTAIRIIRHFNLV